MQIFYLYFIFYILFFFILDQVGKERLLLD